MFQNSKTNDDQFFQSLAFFQFSSIQQLLKIEQQTLDY